MLPEPHQSGSPEEWLRYARSDLVIAKITPTSEMMLEGLCFHAQQAAEKALKGMLITFGIEIPRTHSIRRLLDLLPPEIQVPDPVQDAARLTDYAVVARYPGDLEPVEDTEYQEAVQVAEVVLAWAEKTINGQRELPPILPSNPPEETSVQEDNMSSQTDQTS